MWLVDRSKLYSGSCLDGSAPTPRPLQHLRVTGVHRWREKVQTGDFEAPVSDFGERCFYYGSWESHDEDIWELSSEPSTSTLHKERILDVSEEIHEKATGWGHCPDFKGRSLIAESYF